MCKAPTLRPKTLTKQNSHNVHRDKECYPQFNNQLTHKVHTKKGLNMTTRKMHTHSHTHARTHARTHAHARTHTCALAHARTHTHTHTHTNTHTHMKI